MNKTITKRKISIDEFGEAWKLVEAAKRCGENLDLHDAIEKAKVNNEN